MIFGIDLSHLNTGEIIACVLVLSVSLFLVECGRDMFPTEYGGWTCDCEVITDKEDQKQKGVTNGNS